MVKRIELDITSYPVPEDGSVDISPDEKEILEKVYQALDRGFKEIEYWEEKSWLAARDKIYR